MCIPAKQRTAAFNRQRRPSMMFNVAIARLSDFILMPPIQRITKICKNYSTSQTMAVALPVFRPLYR
jgi:hypothetical protein